VDSGTPGLVDIVREFLAVERALGRLLDRYRWGELRFEEVQALVSDTEESPLFRLKERCHALFRTGSSRSRTVRHREVLFDLAVGSLFHEAMKFRENFYQREVYGPRVRALLGEAGREAEALFREFERILGAVSERLDEGLHETSALLLRTRDQLRVMLAEHPDDGHVARFLIERRDPVEQVFAEDLDALLTEVYGDPAAGYALAGRSYLVSGYYREAEAALHEAAQRGGDRAALEPALAYARGMAAYLASDYRETVAQLARWADPAGKPEPRLLEIAHTAVSKIGDLAQGPEHAATVRAARDLQEQLARLRQGSAQPGPVAR
jgi:hypothetical protein